MQRCINYIHKYKINTGDEMSKQVQEDASEKTFNKAVEEFVKNAEDDKELEPTEEVDVEEVEQPEIEDEIKNLQEQIDETSERLVSLEEGQEKLTSLVEQIAEKLSSKDESEDKSEEETAGDESTEEENNVSNESSNDEETEENEVIENGNSESEEVSKETTEENDDAEQKEVESKKENKMTEAEINALIARIKNEIADEKVEEPKVEEVAEAKTENSISKNWKVRYNQQVAAAWDAYRLKSIDGAKRLAEINKINYQARVEEGLVENAAGDGAMTLRSIDGFVLPPEVDKVIHSRESDYKPFLNQLDISEASSLSFVYMMRTGDISMRSVKLCEDGNTTITDDTAHVRPSNLKPIEHAAYKQGVAQLEEMAAVTPICTSVTRFAAADILADVAKMYRNDYDRKLAQLAIVRFQQAVNETNNVVEFNPATSTAALIDFVKATTKAADNVINGKFLFNAKTKAAILEHLFNSGNGGALSQQAFVNGDTPTIFGYPYVVVPNDLMPTLGTTETRKFTAQKLDGSAIEEVEIKTPVFYGDFSAYRGKIFGGLNYDVSADASYEVYDGTGVKSVRSAWQRNELVLRGSFYRGGYCSDINAISGLKPV